MPLPSPPTPHSTMRGEGLVTCSPPSATCSSPSFPPPHFPSCTKHSALVRLSPPATRREGKIPSPSLSTATRPLALSPGCQEGEDGRQGLQKLPYALAVGGCPHTSPEQHNLKFQKPPVMWWLPTVQPT